jgi:peptidoglycan/LPS O-acetylase OafA/YrhL
VTGDTSNRLDVARGLSALVVLAAHSFQIFLARLATTPDSRFVAINGNAARQAVLVFFVLSGFLITKSIIANIERNGYFDPFDYLSSRVARIYPPFLFALTVSMLVVFVVHQFDLPGGVRPLGEEPLRVRDHLEFTVSELWHALLMQSGMTIIDGPLWTLYIEVKLYFIAMSVALVACGRKALHKMIGVLLALAGLYAIRGDYNCGLFAVAWLVGSAATVRNPSHTRLPALIAAALIGLALVFGPFSGSNVMDSSPNKVLQILCCLVYAHFLLISNRLELDYPDAVRRTGDFSYTLYVVHAPILLLCYSLSLPVIGASWTLSFISQTCAAVLAICVAVVVAPILEDVPFYRGLIHRTWTRVIRFGQRISST